MFLLNVSLGIIFAIFSGLSITKQLRIPHVRTVFCVLFIVFLSFLMGYQEGIADYPIYLYNYQNSLNVPFYASSQWGQKLVEQTFYRIGLPFPLYRTFYFFIGLMLIFRVGKKTMNNPFLLIAAYCIFPMIIDTAQMKNFMAMAVFSNALLCLTTNKKYKYFAFLVWNIIAASFQITAFMYIPFCIFYYLFTKNYYSQRRVILFMAIYALFFLFRPNADLVRTLFLNTLTGSFYSRSEKFFVSNTNHGYLVFLFTTLIAIVLTYSCYKSFSIVKKRRQCEKKCIVQNNNLYVLAFCLAIYSIGFIPLYYFAQDFSRLIRNFSIYFHISTINAIFFITNSKESKYRLPITSLYIIYLIHSFYWEIAIYQSTVINPFFTF